MARPDLGQYVRARTDSQVKQIYVAGPMRGYDLYNFPAFADAAEKLRVKGYKVFSPAENDLRKGFSPETGSYPNGVKFSIREPLMEDLSWICQYADMLAVLPGWETSKGTLAEVYTAYAIGIPVYSLSNILSDRWVEVNREIQN